MERVEISDNFNTDFLLGKVCRNVYHHAQVGEAMVSLSLSISTQEVNNYVGCVH